MCISYDVRQPLTNMLSEPLSEQNIRIQLLHYMKSRRLYSEYVQAQNCVHRIIYTYLYMQWLSYTLPHFHSSLLQDRMHLYLSSFGLLGKIFIAFSCRQIQFLCIHNIIRVHTYSRKQYLDSFGTRSLRRVRLAHIQQHIDVEYINLKETYRSIRIWSCW